MLFSLESTSIPISFSSTCSCGDGPTFWTQDWAHHSNTVRQSPAPAGHNGGFKQERLTHWSKETSLQIFCYNSLGKGALCLLELLYWWDYEQGTDLGQLVTAGRFCLRVKQWEWSYKNASDLEQASPGAQDHGHIVTKLALCLNFLPEPVNSSSY